VPGGVVIEVIEAPSLSVSACPITVAEVRSAARDLDELLTEQEREELVETLAHHPEIGVEIPGTGGLRKFRWKYGGKGKRGGLRVIYFFYNLNMPLYIVAVYRKNEVLRLSKKEESLLMKLVDELVREHATRRRGHVRT
jgi:mRNA-degrading endonuclease RelE of RelBE toxin-antitoxin system